MHAWPLLIPGAVLAGLICFRWVRTVTLFGVAGIALYACQAAHAQSDPYVRCTVGDHYYNTTQGECELRLAIVAEADKFISRYDVGIKNCAEEFGPLVGQPWYRLINLCSETLVNWLSDQRVRGRR